MKDWKRHYWHVRMHYNPRMPLELLFLGTGTSAGVPMIGCHCDVCTSTDARDHRDRASVLISYPDGLIGDELGRPRRLLIDTAPELRSQMIRHSIDAIDGVLYTHGHADHIFGLDDLRRFNAVMHQPIDIFGEKQLLERFFGMFPYIFEPHKNINDGFIPQLIARQIVADQPFDLFDATWTPLRFHHGRLPMVGFRIDLGEAAIAYCTDISTIPPTTYPLLQDLDVLVIDALRYRHHPTHLTVDQALEQIDAIKPRQAFLTHISHDISHADLEPRLPEHVRISFDGLTVSVPTGKGDGAISTAGKKREV